MFDGKLETFIKVAECGSFTKAAEDLYITPTAVMKQINALEKDLSVTLFNRSNHGLRITKSGEAFLQDARYILEYISRAEQKAREIFEGENRKSIRIGTSVMTPAKFILDVWSQIQIRMPTLTITAVSNVAMAVMSTPHIKPILTIIVPVPDLKLILIIV